MIKGEEILVPDGIIMSKAENYLVALIIDLNLPDPAVVNLIRGFAELRNISQAELCGLVILIDSIKKVIVKIKIILRNYLFFKTE